MQYLDVGPCMSEQRACTVHALGSATSECISDVVTGPRTVEKTSCCIEYRLELVDQVCRYAQNNNKRN